MGFLLIDWLIVLVYAVVVITVGLYIVRKPKTSEGYFLANRQLKWPFIGASMLASNISAEHFVGLAGGGYLIGMAIGAAYEWIAIFCLLPLILLFLPFYLKNRIFTVPEFLERRFSPGIRTVFSGLLLVLSVLTKVSISLWASALVFNTLFGWNPIVVMWVVAAITATYTMKGGLSAVVYTDAIQTCVLLVAGAVLTILGLQHVGGWAVLQAKVPADTFRVIKPITHPDVPWTGVFIGIFLGGSFYWSMDQVLVQRAFAAKDVNEGRKGAIFAGALKLLTPFVLVVPGIVARALWPDLPAADQAYPKMLKELMPHGLLGLTVAGIAAALMGHLSATYNSISTLFTRDFYLKFRPGAGHGHQILVGRLAVAAVAVMGATWAPIIGNYKSLWDYLQSVTFYLAAPFIGVFLLGVMWKRITTTGVWAAVITGFVVGPVVLADRLSSKHFLPFLHTTYTEPWLHGATMDILLCMFVLVVVSLLTPPEPDEKLASTTITWGARADVNEPKPPFLSDYRLWLILVLGLTLALYVTFR